MRVRVRKIRKRLKLTYTAMLTGLFADNKMLVAKSNSAAED